MAVKKCPHQCASVEVSGIAAARSLLALATYGATSTKCAASLRSLLPSASLSTWIRLAWLESGPGPGTVAAYGSQLKSDLVGSLQPVVPRISLWPAATHELSIAICSRPMMSGALHMPREITAS